MAVDTLTRPVFNIDDIHACPDLASILRFLVNFAVCAPSLLNTQPWRFRVEDNTIEIWGNPDRKLRIADQNERQLFIALGAALTNISVAADYYGLAFEVDYFPEPRERYFTARLAFDEVRGKLRAARENDDHLVFSVAKRQTNRSPYALRQVPRSFISELDKLSTQGVRVSVVEDDAGRGVLTDIALRAEHIAFLAPGFKDELASWLRTNFTARRDGIPGYTLGYSGFASLFLWFLARRARMAHYQERADEHMLRQTPAFIILQTEADDSVDWTHAGETSEEIALMAERAGLATASLYAPIQVDGCPDDVREALRTVLRPQVFMRLGYATQRLGETPRLPLEEVVI